MVKIIKKEIEIEKELENKLSFICKFCNSKMKVINGSIRTIKKTNISYVEPHRVIIKDKLFLVFNYSDNVYIDNLNNVIKLKDLKNYIKKI